MHYVSCLVALTGDLSNRMHLEGVTTPEVMLLRLIHGENSVTDIRVQSNVKFGKDEMAAERMRMLGMYPRYQEQVIGIWRDSGGKFIESVFTIGLGPAHFAPDGSMPKEALMPPDLLPEDEAEGADA